MNVWCDNLDEESKHAWVIHVTFYPLYLHDNGYDQVDTSTWCALDISAYPREPQDQDLLKYLETLINEDGPDKFSLEYMDWWSNECVFVDPPEILANFIATLPREDN